MDLPPRLKLVLANRGLQVAGVLVVLGLASVAGAAVVYTDEDTRTVTESVDSQQFSTTVETSAIVDGNSTLYEEGERLTNMPVYLFRATPNLTLTVRTTVPQSETVGVTHRLLLVHEATRDGEPFYTEERLLVENDHRVSGTMASDSVTINVTDVRRRMSRMQEEIAGAGSLTARLRLEVAYTSDLYEGEYQATSTLQVTERAYLLAEQLEAADTRSRSNTRTVIEPPDVRLTAGLGILGLVLAAGGVLIYWSRERIDIEGVLTERDHTRYQEWISEGEFPTAADNRYTSINSLEDLVDVAIDTDKRVIYDDDFDAYAVVDGNVVYYFATDPESIDPWLDA